MMIFKYWSFFAFLFLTIGVRAEPHSPVQCLKQALRAMSGVETAPGTRAEQKIETAIKSIREFPPEWKAVGAENLKLLLPEAPIFQKVKYPHSLKMADGTRYYPSFSAQIKITLPDSTLHEIELVIPKDFYAVGPESEVLREKVKLLTENISRLPVPMVKPLHKIVLSPNLSHLSSKTQAMVNRRRELHIFELTVENAEHVVFHESAHLLDDSIWKNQYFPKGKHTWRDAAQRDVHYVSAYAQTDIYEDFAETLYFYLSTQGGKTDLALRTKFANRFAFLDELLDPKNEEVWRMIAAKYASHQNFYRWMLGGAAGAAAVEHWHLWSDDGN